MSNKYKPFLVITLFLMSSPLARAATCVGGGQVPDPVQILCPIFKIVNVGILLGGVAFAGMIAIGTIKLAMSMGDPKGLSSAAKTWTYALLGAVIVIGAVAIVRLLFTMFGINIGDPANIYSTATGGITDFLELLGVTN